MAFFSLNRYALVYRPNNSPNDIRQGHSPVEQHLARVIRNLEISTKGAYIKAAL